MDKIRVHELGLKHPAVSVFAMSGNDVLIQQRASDKYHTPNLWANTCCTHPLWGEAPETCAVRRLDDELGIKGLSVEWRGQVEYRADVGSGLIEHEVVEVFVAKTDLSLRISPNPDEVQDVQWMNVSRLLEEVQLNPTKFTPWLKIYLERYLPLIVEAAN